MQDCQALEGLRPREGEKGCLLSYSFKRAKCVLPFLLWLLEVFAETQASVDTKRPLGKL